jgi:hypothetical protein
MQRIDAIPIRRLAAFAAPLALLMANSAKRTA